jgi:predicted ATPase/DNA-binding SARP family transcriptional activator
VSCLAVRLLGSPRIERDGVPIEVDTRKATALIAYLALSGQRQSRDTLGGFLWPDAESGRAALRRTLSVLGRALGGGFLRADRESIELENSPDLWIDVREFERATKGCESHSGSARDDCDACLTALDQAAAVYRGDFLEGFGLRDSDRFDDWRLFQAERLRRELGPVLQRLARGYSARREHAKAIEFARRWLALDPLHEPAHRALMRAYARSGQRSAALRQYRECVRILDHELSVPPLEETIKLYEAIKDDRRVSPENVQADHQVDAARAGPASDSGPSRPALLARTPPDGDGSGMLLVGRDGEWARLIRAYDAATHGRQVVVVEGEAGVGKTRLVEALVEHTRRAGATIITTRCFQGEGNLAFGPFLDMLRAILREPENATRLAAAPAYSVAEAARLLPDLTALRRDLPSVAPLDSPGGQNRFFEGVCQVVLAATSGSRPGVLVFDDLQWADTSSLDLLAYLVRRIQKHPLCVVLVWRTEEVPPGHTLRRILAEAERDGRGMSTRLARLDEVAVRELVARLRPTSSPPPDGFVERLFHETEGLPFFVVTYLAALEGNHRVPDLEWTLPASGRDFLRARLTSLSDTAHQLLSAASVIGRSFDFDTARLASGRSEEETLTALDELLARGVIIEVAGATHVVAETDRSLLRYDFSHEKLRSVVYDDTSLARRRLLHRRVAEALVALSHRSHDGPDVDGIAHHNQLAGLDAEAAPYYKQAGERARALYANNEALWHFRAALALGHPDPAGLHEAIGDLLTLLGEFQQALRSYEAAAALADKGALEHLERKLGTIYHRLGEWELAESHFNAALDSSEEPGSAGERARLFADWSLTAHRQDRPDEARRLATRAIELARTAGDDRALAQSHNLFGILSKGDGDLVSARQHLEEARALSERLGDATGRAASLNNLALVCARLGDSEGAIHFAETALTICQRQGDRHREAALYNNLADILHAIGDETASREHLRQAVVIFAEIGADAGDSQPEIWKLSEW